MNKKSELVNLVSIRHGDYTINGLSDEGINQIKKHLNYLEQIVKSSNSSIIISSDYQRAKQTSEIINSILNIKISYDPALRLQEKTDSKELLKTYQKLIDEKYTNFSTIIMIGHAPIGYFPIEYAKSRGMSIKPEKNLIYGKEGFETTGTGTHYDIKNEIIYTLPKTILK